MQHLATIGVGGPIPKTARIDTIKTITVTIMKPFPGQVLQVSILMTQLKAGDMLKKLIEADPK